MLVFVLNKHGKPLMPCKPSKARKLLKQGKAKIVQYEPFTIQLLYNSSGYKQKCVMGIDAGNKNIGIAVTTEDGRVLYKTQVALRQDIRENIDVKEVVTKSGKWCLWDKVKITTTGEIGFISGSTGKWVYVQDIYGNYLQLSDKYKQINPSELVLICRNNNYITQQFISTL